MEATGEVRYAVQGGQAHLTIDRPRARSVIGPAVLREVCAVDANLDRMEDGAEFVFIYRDADQSPLFQITLGSCGG